MALHIGEKIKAKAAELRLGPTEFSKLIHTSKQNVHQIYKRKSIDTELLKKISEALEFDFFSYYTENSVPAVNEIQKPALRRPLKNLADADREIELLWKELNELREKAEKQKKVISPVKRKR
jgi:hypothetical protein